MKTLHTLGKSLNDDGLGTGRVIRRSIAFIIAFGSLVVSLPAYAGPSESDVAIAARALGFLEKPLNGAVRVGIAYAADIPLSAQNAVALQQIMNSGLKVAGLSLKPVLVPVDAAGAAAVDLLFLAEATGAGASKVRAAARTRTLPCITLDIDQVSNGNCAIGIKSEPRVEILVNREAASRSGVSFAGAFKMLITEF